MLDFNSIFRSYFRSTDRRSASAGRSWGPVLLFAAVIGAGFQPGDLVELRHSINGHRDSDVRSSARNVNLVVPAGARGAVRSYRKLRSGGYAVEIEIRSGGPAGKTAWIYQDANRPVLALYGDAASRQKQVVRTPEAARSARTIAQATASVIAPVAPKLPGLPQSRALAQFIGSLSEMEPMSAGGSDCEVQKPDPVPAAPGRYPENESIEPSKDAHSGILPDSIRCETRDDGYELCHETPSGGIHSFHFEHRPDGAGEYVTRSWEFVRSENARQELEFRVSDTTDEYLSHTVETYVRLFPRKVVPSIRREGDQLRVTLPTGEAMLFDARTRKVVGGVISETPIQPARFDFKYSGSGVMVVAARRGDDPRNNSQVLITKPGRPARPGEKPCRVPSSRLWTADADNPQFRFPTDDGFDEFVRKTCGFSIY